MGPGTARVAPGMGSDSRLTPMDALAGVMMPRLCVAML